MSVWTFPEGSVAHDQSVKGYDVEGSDGHLGTCAWADYKPGESYLVVEHKHHLHHDVQRLVPAGAVASVDHDARVVTLKVRCDEVHATPEYDRGEQPLEPEYVSQFERGMLGGGFVWPYTDV
jgi:hypothetical protein